MKFLKYTFTAFLIFMLFSCGSNGVKKQQYTFEDNRWGVSVHPEFVFRMNDTQGEYQILADIEHTSALLLDDLELALNIESDAGEKRSLDVVLPIRQRNGAFKGELKGDYRQLCVPLRHHFKFHSKGNYTFTLWNITGKSSLKGIHKIGIVIKKEEDAH